MEVPVYLINGFLESGKTSFIQTTLADPEFVNGDRILLLVCEEGEVEYDELAYAKKNIFIVNVDYRSTTTKTITRYTIIKYYAATCLSI